MSGKELREAPTGRFEIAAPWLRAAGIIAMVGALVLAFVAGMRVSDAGPRHDFTKVFFVLLLMALFFVTALTLVHLLLRRAQDARERAEVVLRENARHLQLVLDTVPDRIWVKDAAGRYIMVNRAEADAQGETPEQLLGKTVYDQQGPGPAALVEQEDRRVLASGQPMRMERQSNLGSGWIEMIKVPFAEADGRTRGLLGIARDINARKEAEAAWATLSALIDEHRAVAIYERGLDGTIRSWSAGAQAMLGYSAEEAIGMSATFSMPPDEPRKMDGNSARLLRGECFTTASRRLTRDGRMLHVIGSHAPIRDAAGNIVGGSILLQDVTALREAEIRAKQEEGRYSALFEYCPMPVLIWEQATGRIVDANEAAVATWAYSREELLALRIVDLHDPEFAAEYEGFIEQLPRDRTFRSLPRRHRTKDGRRLHMEVSSAPIDGYGRGNRMSVLHDVSERHRAEETLREARSFLLQTLDSFPGMLVVMDNEHRALFVNRAVAEYLGVDAQTLQARPDMTINGRDWSREDKLFNCESVLMTQVRFDAEVRRDTVSQGAQWFQTLRVPLMQPSGMAGVLLIIIDITALKRASAQIQQMNAELEQRVAERTAQLMAANRELEAFAFSVSHDLRAPLRGIDGFSQSLVDEFAAQLPAQARDYLQRVRNASRRMGEMIEGMLALSKLARAEFTVMPVNLAALANDIVAELNVLGVARNAAITIAPDMPARGDPRLLRVVLENLIGNAVKFSAQGAAPRIEIGVERQGAERVYFVRDNGVGFSMEHADKLFGVFSRLHSEREFPGNGVGLASVQRVVQRHGGRVWASSEKDRGAVFYFTLGDIGALTRQPVLPAN